MQLEAVEPAQRSLAAGRIDGEHAVLWDTGVRADGQGRGVDEAEAGAPAHLGLQIGDQRQEHTRHEFDEPGIAHQLGELRMQLLRHVLGVIGLESAVMRGLKEDQDGHDLTGMQLARPSALPLARGQHLTVPQRLEADPELVDRAEEFEYTHDRNLLMIGTVDRAAIVSGGFSFGDFAYPELTLNTRIRAQDTAVCRVGVNSKRGHETDGDAHMCVSRSGTSIGDVSVRGEWTARGRGRRWLDLTTAHSDLPGAPRAPHPHGVRV